MTILPLCKIASLKMVMRLFLGGKSTAAGGSLHILEQEVSYSFERQSLTLRL